MLITFIRLSENISLALVVIVVVEQNSIYLMYCSTNFVPETTTKSHQKLCSIFVFSYFKSSVHIKGNVLFQLE